MHRLLMRLALLAVVTSGTGCRAPKSGPSAPAAADHVLTVRSNYWSPLDIDLIGNGFRRRIGTVERLKPRTFRIPAHLVASGAFVSLEARDAIEATSYSTGLFGLATGETVELLLEHSLTLSTFAVRHPR